MTRFTKILITATAAALLAAPVGAASEPFIPGKTDFPSVNRAERFIPGVTDFPSVSRETGYHVVVSAPKPTAAPTAPGRGGFAWADAGIGAAAGIALMLLILGSTLALRRRSGGALR